MKMRRSAICWSLVLLCALMRGGVVQAKCVTSKQGVGYMFRVQCSNVTLAMLQAQAANPVVSYMIFQSDLRRIPAQAFVDQAFTLQSLSLHQCGIREIHPRAFAGLSALKTLELSNNQLTDVQEEWFIDLHSLEQLDLSYNNISRIPPIAFLRLRNLKRLDVRMNRIHHLSTAVLEPMNGLEKFRFYGNPLSFVSRGKLTLWLRNRGVWYKTSEQEKEDWLDSLIWHCAIIDPRIGESEGLMKECVVLSMFNQLRSGLITAESYPLEVSPECKARRNLLTSCVARNETSNHGRSSGDAIRRLLLALDHVKFD